MQVGFVKASSLLVLYGLFVVLVLAADIYHRIRSGSCLVQVSLLCLRQSSLSLVSFAANSGYRDVPLQPNSAGQHCLQAYAPNAVPAFLVHSVKNKFILVGVKHHLQLRYARPASQQRVERLTQ